MSMEMSFQGYFEPLAAIHRVTGEKAGHLLHGQLSNHINGLKDGEANYNLLLTQKGKVVADLYVYRTESDFLLIIDKPGEQKVIDHLKKFAPLSRVEIGDETAKYFFVHAFGIKLPHKEGLLTLRGGERGSYVYQSDRLGLPGYDFLIPADKKEELLARLKQENFSEIAPATQEVLRVEQGICKVGIDATEENLPQEARLDRALNFDKGCYLGQETIARLHFLGHVNRVLAGLKIEPNNAVEKKAPIFDGEKRVGKITSSVFSPTLNTVFVLGYIPFALNQAGREFRVGEKKIGARVVELPLESQDRPAA
ncbi:MAG: tRNA-modifying protein YgfZ [Deltaproteobacteria bacterium]|nr:tRNA-modifying protein YgfZ [Deltaproteobacteria bacterium]